MKERFQPADPEPDRRPDPSSGDVQGSLTGPRPNARWGRTIDRREGDAPDRRALAEAALDAALHFSGAPRGNVQFLHEDGVLRIEAQRGFERPFLDFFREVDHRGSACGEARATGRAVVVEDVASTTLYDGTEGRQAMLEAGARAVTSIPIVGRAGGLVGILSVHWESVHRPDDHTLARLDGIARRIGKLL